MESLPVVFCVLLLLSFLGCSDGAEKKERRPRNCKKPYGKLGKSYIKACTKYTCTKPSRNKYVWVESFAGTKCCSFDQIGYPIGSSIETVLLPDMCTQVSLMCKRKEGAAEMELVVENDCPQRPGIMNVILNTTEVIKSPRFASPYPPNVDECWMRTPSCGYGVQLEFTYFDVLGDDAHISIDPPVSGESKFFGNSFNSAHAPPEIISFPADHAVKICFKSGQIVNGHKGFKAEITETIRSNWITSPNYPVINDDNYLDSPSNGYGTSIHQCWVRSPSTNRALGLEFFHFDIHAPPKNTGDWMTIFPVPTSKPMAKYYGVDLQAPEAPPTISSYPENTIVTICLITRSGVDDHDGFLAEFYDEMGPSTIEPTTNYDYSNYDYSSYQYST